MDEVASPSGLSGKGMVVPVAAIGALSQAWFDALGLARPKSAAPAKTVAMPEAMAKHKVSLPSSGGMAVDSKIVEIAPLSKARVGSIQTRVGRAIRLDVAVRIRKQSALAPTHDAANDVLKRSAGRITIRSKRGTVRMLVQREAGRMRITAVCEGANTNSVAASLEQARRRLQARGITVDFNTHQENAA